MKKSMIVSFFLSSMIIFNACNKKEDPAPVVNTMQINPNDTNNTPENTTSTTAPSLNPEVVATATVVAGSINSEVLDLSTLITEPQGEVWTITSVTSSNPAIATAFVKAGTASQSIEYVGVKSGSVTLTMVVTDASGHTNTIYYNLSVASDTNINPPSATAPYLNSGVPTSLSVITGATNAATLDLTNSVTEPQGQGWYISSYSSSNTSVATVAIAPASDSKAIRYTGVTAGTTTLTLILNDLENNTQTVAFNITVLTNPNGPTLDPGVNTNLNIQEGSSAPWNLEGNVTDPNALSWFVSSVSSSNTSIATVRIDGVKQIDYLGVAPGQATLSIVLVNSDGAEKTILVNVYVNSKGPKGGGGLPGGGGVVVGPGGGVIPK